MSDEYGYFSAPARPTTFGAPGPSLPSAPPPRMPPAPSTGKRQPPRLLLAVGAVAVLAAVLAGWWFRPVGHRGPVVLPESALGLPPAAEIVDFGSHPDWKAMTARDFPGVTLEGRGYSAGQGARPLMVNVVVARTDLTGKLDRRMAVKPYTSYGDVTCSHTFDLKTVVTPDAGTGTLPNMALCWRTSRGLSVSIMALTQGDVTDAQIAAEVQRVWDLQPSV